MKYAGDGRPIAVGDLVTYTFCNSTALCIYLGPRTSVDHVLFDCVERTVDHYAIDCGPIMIMSSLEGAACDP